MFSLNDLLQNHRNILILDTASSRIQVGLACGGAALQWGASQDEAGVAVFAISHQLLTTAGLRISDLDAFVFCEGPGSVLGIRTAAVALRTWCALKNRPCYAYNSLQLVAHFELHAARGVPFSVIADARRETWHVVEVNTAGPAPLARKATRDISAPPLMPEHFRNWTGLPDSAQKVPYDVGTMLATLRQQPLFHPAPAPDAFLHEEPVYQTWTPQVHQAPR